MFTKLNKLTCFNYVFTQSIYNIYVMSCRKIIQFNGVRMCLQYLGKICFRKCCRAGHSRIK